MTKEEIDNYKKIETDKIRLKLLAKNMRLLDSSARYEGDKLLVVFRDKSKYKIGFIRANYMHRYGVDVFFTLEEGEEIPWIKGNSYKKYITSCYLHNIKNANIKCYRLLNIDRDLDNVEH